MSRPDGLQFNVAAHEVAEVPKRGEVVTFTYDSYSPNEIPVNPKLYRTRTDVSWEDVVMEHTRNEPQAQNFNGK